ncbi:MAG: hypothetical protein AABX17_02125 [Nanoarchaeota archaeon]
MKIKNKKAEINAETVVAILIVALTVGGILYWLFMADGLTILKNVLPSFGSGNKAMASGDASSQPLELRTDDPCLDYAFYWADATGKNINGLTIEPGLVYVAIKFKDDIGNLADSKNPKYACRTYALVTRDIRDDVSIVSLFLNIQKDYTPKMIGTKSYYFIDRIVEDAGWAKNGEYTFDIFKNYPDKNSIVRRGFPLHVEYNIRFVPWI